MSRVSVAKKKKKNPLDSLSDDERTLISFSFSLLRLSLSNYHKLMHLSVNLYQEMVTSCSVISSRCSISCRSLTWGCKFVFELTFDFVSQVFCWLFILSTSDDSSKMLPMLLNHQWLRCRIYPVDGSSILIDDVRVYAIRQRLERFVLFPLLLWRIASLRKVSH